MKTELGTLYAETLHADSIDQIISWCETAAEGCFTAAKLAGNMAEAKPFMSDAGDFRHAADVLRALKVEG